MTLERYDFPSAVNLSCPQTEDNSTFLSFKVFQYLLELLIPINAEMISTAEYKHFLLSLSHLARTGMVLKNLINALVVMTSSPLLLYILIYITVIASLTKICLLNFT